MSPFLFCPSNSELTIDRCPFAPNYMRFSHLIVKMRDHHLAAEEGGTPTPQNEQTISWYQWPTCGNKKRPPEGWLSEGAEELGTTLSPWHQKKGQKVTRTHVTAHTTSQSSHSLPVLRNVKFLGPKSKVFPCKTRSSAQGAESCVFIPLKARLLTTACSVLGPGSVAKRWPGGRLLCLHEKGGNSHGPRYGNTRASTARKTGGALAPKAKPNLAKATGGGEKVGAVRDPWIATLHVAQGAQGVNSYASNLNVRTHRI